MITINPTSEAIKFHQEKVLDTFETLISNGYIKRNNKIKNICKEFISFLEKYKLELITAKPNRLIEIHEEYKKKQFSKHQIELIKSFSSKQAMVVFQTKNF